MRGVDGRGEAVDVRVAVFAGGVEARAAAEDDVGAGERGGLAGGHLGRGVGEERELVHRIDDQHVGTEALGERKRERRVEPRVAAAQSVGFHETVDEGGEVRHLRRRESGRVLDGRSRPQNRHAVGRRGALPVGALCTYHRLLDEHDRTVGGEPREQVLRALVDEVPTKVREDDERRIDGHGADWNCGTTPKPMHPPHQKRPPNEHPMALVTTSLTPHMPLPTERRCAYSHAS